MKQLFKSFILCLFILIFVASPLAAAFTAIISVVESSGNSYDMVASNVTTNIDYMADNDYFATSTGLDTRVADGTTPIPHMLVEDRILFADSILTFQNKYYNFTTDNAPLTVFDIIGGYNSSINVTDSANLEHGANFTDTFNGYIDTDAGADKYILSKATAFNVYVNPTTSGTINATINDNATTTETERPTANGSLIECTPQSGTNWGSVSDSNDATYIYANTTQPTYRTDLYTTSNMTGGVDITKIVTTIRIRSFNAAISAYGKPALNINGTVYYGAVHTQANAWANFTDTFNTNPDTGESWTVNDINNMELGIALASSNSGTGPGYCAEVWMVITYYLVDIEVSATGVSSGEHELIVGINATHLYMELDSVVVDSQAIGGSSVPDRAINYVLLQNNVMPYADNITFYIGGTRQLWYEPNDIIALNADNVTGILPDRQGGDNDGTITFGSNPAGIVLSLGALISDYSGTIIDTTETPSFVPAGVTPQPTATAIKEAALVAHPFYPWVSAFNTTTTVGILFQFQFIYIAGALFAFTGTFTWIRNMFLSGGLFVAVIGLGVTQSVFDWWVLLLVIPVWIGLTVMENRQTI